MKNVIFIVILYLNYFYIFDIVVNKNDALNESGILFFFWNKVEYLMT